MIKQVIGENAGQIWQLLDKNGETQLADLLQMSKMEETTFNMSIGWLAREGKISFYDEDGKQMIVLIY